MEHFNGLNIPFFFFIFNQTEDQAVIALCLLPLILERTPKSGPSPSHFLYQVRINVLHHTDT